MEISLPTQSQFNARPLTSKPRIESKKERVSTVENKKRPNTSVQPVPSRKPPLPKVQLTKPDQIIKTLTRPASSSKPNMDFRTILPSYSYKDKMFNKYWETTTTESQTVKKKKIPTLSHQENTQTESRYYNMTTETLILENRLLYKYPHINWETKTPTGFLSHVGGSEFSLSRCETTPSSRITSGKPVTTPNAFNRPFTAFETKMKSKHTIQPASARNKVNRPVTAMPKYFPKFNSQEEELAYLIYEEEMIQKQKMEQYPKVDSLFNKYKGMNVKNYSIKTAQADTDLLEIFDRSQRTKAATLSKVGDYEYYTSSQRIGSFIDYSNHMKEEDLRNIEKHILETQCNMVCYQSKHNIQPANNLIPTSNSKYFNDANSLFYGFMPNEDTTNYNQYHYTYEPIDFLPKYSSDEIYNEELYPEEFIRNVTTSINNYNKYLDSSKIHKSDLQPFNLQQLTKIVIQKINFSLIGKNKKILDSNMSEIEKLYYHILKTIIMDYILRSPHERKRLNIVYYPRKALPSSFVIALNGSFNRTIYPTWVDNYANAFISIEKNLSLCNIAVSGIIDWTYSFKHVDLIYVKKLALLKSKDINAIHIDAFCSIEESYLKKIKMFMRDIYYRGCVLITKKNKCFKRKDLSPQGKWTFKGFVPDKTKMEDDHYGMYYEDQLTDFWTHLDLNDLIDIRLTSSNFCYVTYLLHKQIELDSNDYDDLPADAKIKLNNSVTAYCSIFLRKLIEKALNDYCEFFESFESNDVLFKRHREEKVNFSNEIEYKEKELKLPAMLSFDISHLVDPYISIKTKYESIYNLIKLEYNFDQIYEKLIRIVELISTLFNTFCSTHFLELKKILPSSKEHMVKEHSTKLHNFFNSDPNQNKSFLDEYFSSLCPNLVLEEIETEHYMKTYLKIINYNELFVSNIKSRIYRQLKFQFSEIEECLAIFDPLKEVYVNSFDESVKVFLETYNSTLDYNRYTDFIEKIRRFQKYIKTIPDRLSYSMFAIDLRTTKDELNEKVTHDLNQIVKSLEIQIIEFYDKNIMKYSELIKLIDMKLTTPEEVVAMEKTKARVSSELAGVTRDFDDSYKIAIYLLKIDHIFSNEIIAKTEEVKTTHIKFKEDQDRIEKMHRENRDFLENKFKEDKQQIEIDLEEFFKDINLFDNQTHITEYENVLSTINYNLDRVVIMKARIDRNLLDEELLFDYRMGTFELYDLCVSKLNKLAVLWVNIESFYETRKEMIHSFSEDIDVPGYIGMFIDIAEKVNQNKHNLKTNEEIILKMSKILEDDIESINGFLKITHKVIEAPYPMDDALKEIVENILGTKAMEPSCREILFTFYSKKSK